MKHPVIAIILTLAASSPAYAQCCMSQDEQNQINSQADFDRQAAEQRQAQQQAEANQRQADQQMQADYEHERMEEQMHQSSGGY